MQLKRDLPIELEITPAELGDKIASASYDEQIEFFTALHKAMVHDCRTLENAIFELEQIADELPPGARHLLATLGPRN